MIGNKVLLFKVFITGSTMQKIIKEFIKSISMVWQITSYSIIILLIMIFVLNESTLLSISPQCISQINYGKPCALCGMTRAFTEISRFDFAKAYQLNSLSLILISIFLINSFILLYYITKRKRGHNEYS